MTDRHDEAGVGADMGAPCPREGETLAQKQARAERSFLVELIDSARQGDTLPLIMSRVAERAGWSPADAFALARQRPAGRVRGNESNPDVQVLHFTGPPQDTNTDRGRRARAHADGDVSP